jgi:carbon storage regulator CsrA
MLNMTRRAGERVIITCPDGTQIEVVVTECRNGRAKLGIEAPRDYIIDREELLLARAMEESGGVTNGNR